jgi:multidrug efflux pump subunit AcrA (membrane-fusion protein)
LEAEFATSPDRQAGARPTVAAAVRCMLQPLRVRTPDSLAMLQNATVNVRISVEAIANCVVEVSVGVKPFLVG